MRKFLFISIPIVIFASSCGEGREGGDSNHVDNRTRSEMIIDSAIAFHGGEKYYGHDISFGFRDRMYSISRSANSFAYTSTYSDSFGVHHRELSNDGLVVHLNGERVALSAKDSTAYAASVNSVVYFAMLPSLLTDDAVRSVYEGDESINGKSYYRVKVTFTEEGGGEDHDDVYLYWFDTTDYSLDFLAYSFLVENGGTRFRAVTNTRRINGIVFQDYENYKGPAPDSLQYISEMYKSGSLTLLSNIELNRISVIERPTAISSLN